MDFENILRTIQPFVIMFAALFAAFLTAVWISVVIWTFRDIRARSRDVFAQILATLLVLIFFPFFPFLGLILYMILRPRETLSEVYERSLEEEALLQGIEERLACPGCNRRIEEEFMICPTCHTRLKKACPACGHLLHLRWNLCPYCGAMQTAAKAVPMPPQPVALQAESMAPAPLPETIDDAPEIVEDVPVSVGEVPVSVGEVPVSIGEAPLSAAETVIEPDPVFEAEPELADEETLIIDSEDPLPNDWYEPEPKSDPPEARTDTLPFEFD